MDDATVGWFSESLLRCSTDWNGKFMGLPSERGEAYINGAGSRAIDRGGDLLQ